MKQTILKFGLISGVFTSAMMLATVPLENKIGFDRSEYLGYTLIVLSFLLVFFGVRSYRDNVTNGQITFTKAFLVGISITVITCLFYVVTWEVLYFNFMHDFIDKYSAHVVEKLQAQGATPAAVQAKVLEMKKYKDTYDNPFYNSAITFLEPFPVGLVITLITAAVLRKRKVPTPAAPLQFQV